MTPHPNRHPAECAPGLHAHRAFTIVEMLVVIGIIMLLMAIMLPSLSAVMTRSRKTVELNNLRQVGLAWNMYANQNKDAALPGYLDENPTHGTVQEAWRVRYEFPFPPNHGTGPNGSDPTIPTETAGPWTWRLAQYFDYNPEILWGYRNEAVNDVQELVNNAELAAHTPAFGYNAYYVGGFWRIEPGDSGTNTRPRHSFWDATVDGSPAHLVVRTTSSMKQPENLITFCSAARYEQTGVYASLHNELPGSHLVTPPTLAEDAMWRMPSIAGSGQMGDASGGGGIAGGSGNRDMLEVVEMPAHAPLARHNAFVAALYGDGSTATEVVGDLNDQRKWINGLTSMDDREFTHTGTYWKAPPPPPGF